MTKQLMQEVHLRNGASLNNRVVQPPMQTFSGEERGYLSDEGQAYYSARSQSAGLIITEFHYVSENGGSSTSPGIPEQQAAFSDDYMDSLTQLAKTIKQDGNKAVLQIHHGGREAATLATKGENVYAPSAIDFPFIDYALTELSEEQILDIIKDFGRATSRAIRAGFDGVEIHGANHYLIQQFFSAYSNRREDQWGGSFENRSRFAHEVSKEVKRVIDEEAKEDFIFGYRISPEEIHGDNIGYTYEDSTQLVKDLQVYGFDYIHLSIFGQYNDGPTSLDKSYGELFKEILDPETVLIIIGSIFKKEDFKDALNYGDLVAGGRASLLNPQLAKKLEAGEDLYTEMSEEVLDQAVWTPGLKKAYTSGAGLPPIKNINSIKD